MGKYCYPSKIVVPESVDSIESHKKCLLTEEDKRINHIASGTKSN